MELTAFEQAHPAAAVAETEILQEAITQATDPAVLAALQTELDQVQS